MAFNGTTAIQMTVIMANQIDIILRGSLVQADQPNRRAGSKCCLATNMIAFACRPKSLHRRFCLATKSNPRRLLCGYQPAKIILGVERVEVLIEPWSVDTRYRSRTNVSENKVLPM